jgi:putative SOS response-associated peptidase YedK
MCGRFVLMTPGKELAEQFRCDEFADLGPRYNIAPTQLVAIVRFNRETRRRECELLKWGLIPSWSEDPSIGPRLINARAESAGTKPAFRSAFKYRRCLVVADGFYEWKKLDNKRKQPYLFRLSSGKPFAFAGLWERWSSPDGQVTESCAVLTTDSNDLLRSVHDRMPVILKPDDYTVWLDPEVKTPERLQSMLKPYPPDEMVGRSVSSTVNKADHEGPDCVEPAAEEGPQAHAQSLFS